MSGHLLYFDFSVGINSTIKVPMGTYELLNNHINLVTDVLDLEISRSEDDKSKHWVGYSPSSEIPDKIASETVFSHNEFVVRFYDDLQKWAKAPPNEYEEFTPELAKSIWYGLSRLNVTYDRWTDDIRQGEMKKLHHIMTGSEDYGTTMSGEPLTVSQASAVIQLFSSCFDKPYSYWNSDTYESGMGDLFEVMRGSFYADDDIEFKADNLTNKQAARIIWLFCGYFDVSDIRLEMPNGYDFLVTSDDYDWCGEHGAWLKDDAVLRCSVCKGKGEQDYWGDCECDADQEAVCPADDCEEIIWE